MPNDCSNAQIRILCMYNLSVKISTFAVESFLNHGKFFTLENFCTIFLCRVTKRMYRSRSRNIIVYTNIRKRNRIILVATTPCCKNVCWISWISTKTTCTMIIPHFLVPMYFSSFRWHKVLIYLLNVIFLINNYFTDWELDDCEEQPPCGDDLLPFPMSPALSSKTNLSNKLGFYTIGAYDLDSSTSE